MNATVRMRNNHPEEIASLAYQLWEKGGRKPSCDLENWLFSICFLWQFRKLSITIGLSVAARSVALAALVAVSTTISACADSLAVLPDLVVGTNVAGGDSAEGPAPVVGCDGTNYLVVIHRSVGEPIGLVGVIISHKGATTHEFSIGGESDQFTNPSLAFGGTNYLLVFNYRDQTYGLRISVDGQLLDTSSGFQISSGAPAQIYNYTPRVTFDGRNFLVVWQRFEGWGHSIYGARVTPDGQVLDEFPIFSDPVVATFLQVASDGANSLVIFGHEKGIWPNADVDIYGVRVSRAGGILDPAGIEICSATNDQGSAYLAFDGRNYLVTWLDRRNYPDDSYAYDIFGARVGTNGVVLDGPPSSGGIPINTFFADYKNDPRVCFDGRDFLITWWLSTYSPPCGSFAARVSSDGVLLDRTPESQGLQIRTPNCFTCKVVHPVPVSNQRSVLVPWLLNTEGGFKNVFANLIVPEPCISGFAVRSPGPDDVKLTFSSRLGVSYLAEWSSNLATWQTQPNPITGIGLPMEIVLPGQAGAAQRFFRVQVDY